MNIQFIKKDTNSLFYYYDKKYNLEINVNKSSLFTKDIKQNYIKYNFSNIDFNNLKIKIYDSDKSKYLISKILKTLNLKYFINVKDTEHKQIKLDDKYFKEFDQENKQLNNKNFKYNILTYEYFEFITAEDYIDKIKNIKEKQKFIIDLYIFVIEALQEIYKYLPKFYYNNLDLNDIIIKKINYNCEFKIFNYQRISVFDKNNLILNNDALDDYYKIYFTKQYFNDEEIIQNLNINYFLTNLFFYIFINELFNNEFLNLLKNNNLQTFYNLYKKIYTTYLSNDEEMFNITDKEYFHKANVAQIITRVLLSEKFLWYNCLNDLKSYLNKNS